MILNDELNVSLLNDIECVQTFISVFHFSTFKYNKSVDTNIYLQAHGDWLSMYTLNTSLMHGYCKLVLIFKLHTDLTY